MFVRILLVLMVLAAVIGALAYIKYSQIQSEIAMFSQPMPAPTVTAVTVAMTAWEPTLEAVGTLQAIQGVEVNNEVAGQVTAITFESGAMVKKGDILVRLADEVDRADLEGLQAAERLARIKVDRNRSLLKDRAVAQGDFDEISAQLDQARAQVKAKQATIEKKTIRAPFDGQLGIRRIDLGQFLAEGSSIVPLQTLDPIYVDYALPERHLGLLRVGQQVQVRVSAHPDRTFDGVIRVISPGIDQGTRNVRIRAGLNNPDLALRPGGFARVATLLPREDAVITIPREAVAFNTYGDAVFVIREEDGKTLVERRQVRTGAVRGEEIAVLEGLAAGERIVLSGQVKLGNAQEVRIVDARNDTPAVGTSEPETKPETESEREAERLPEDTGT
ncbi:efflux RND transporter periplasmic adaptor subunit [Thiocapsa sp. UBA6158]|jgi:membrane fusion protein (multidrug efflux system)|uniref:efflux RND transporter periplasmic adaptor subunit n=1 Tax=Thiocapsa sp. UBA6158 TaxID=1947692 RepID=UPI0025EFF099|nr:efflux RND transporter periplasmic adaptor subunit [Thiocapsa sp. UBA6158]